MQELGRGGLKEVLGLTPTALGYVLAVCGLTPELSRTALRPWASETQWYLHEAAKRARLERIVRRLPRSLPTVILDLRVSAHEPEDEAEHDDG
jgi:hypothetical protein